MMPHWELARNKPIKLVHKPLVTANNEHEASGVSQPPPSHRHRGLCGRGGSATGTSTLRAHCALLFIRQEASPGSLICASSQPWDRVSAFHLFALSFYACTRRRVKIYETASMNRTSWKGESRCAICMCVCVCVW